MSETASATVPLCDIRSAGSRRMLAKASHDGIILYCRSEKKTYTLAWEVIDQIKQEALQGNHITKLLA